MMEQSRGLLEFVAKEGPLSLYSLARSLKKGSETEEESFERITDQTYWLLAVGLLEKKLTETEDGTEVMVSATRAGRDIIKIEKAIR